MAKLLGGWFGHSLALLSDSVHSLGDAISSASILAALWWAERGIAIYGSDCAQPEAIEDLRNRTAKYRAKLAEQPGP